MSTAISKAGKTASAARTSRSGGFVRLKDGRELFLPPAGGKISKAEIRRAVIAVKEARGERK